MNIQNSTIIALAVRQINANMQNHLRNYSSTDLCQTDDVAFNVEKFIKWMSRFLYRSTGVTSRDVDFEEWGENRRHLFHLYHRIVLLKLELV